jgi:spore maturation protein CgeB
MRWLIGHPGPQFSVHDLYEGWREALQALGEEVYSFRLDDRLQFFDAAFHEVPEVTNGDGQPGFRKSLSRGQAIQNAAEGILSAAYQTWPDVILLISAFFIPPLYLDIFRDRGHKVVLLHSESPYQDDEQLIRAAHADINLLNDPVNIAAYREFGPAAYMPHAYRPKVHYPAGPGAAKKWDLAFVGTGFPSRVQLFEQLDLHGLDVYLAGPWMDLPENSRLRDWADPRPNGCVDNAETAEIYRQAKCGINLYRQESEEAHRGEGWACGPREIEMAACGLWFTRDSRGEGDELFPMLPRFHSPQEASDLIRWYAAHDDHRERQAAMAREAIADRTFTSNARKLLAMLNH